MSTEWFVMKEDRELGPYSWEEMLEMAGRGEIQPADPVFTESLGDWTEAAQIEDLFSANLPAAYDDAAVPAVVSSVPGPATLTPAAFQARRITLPVILIALAILLLSGGVLAYFLNRGDSELAEEIYLVTPEGELIATGQSAKTTGPPLYSLGPGRVPAGFSRTTPADPEDDDLSLLDPATPQHSVYNVLLNQPSPSTLPVGTPVGYSFNYLTTHSGSVRINGVPLRGGSPLRDIAFNPPADYSTGRGGGSGFFTVRSAGPVDGFRIRMYAAGTDTVLHERVYDLDLTFTPLVGEAPPDADPDPDPDPADPEPPDPDPDPDPGPGAPEEPVPPVPPDDGGPGDGDPPVPLENAIFNIEFHPLDDTYPTDFLINYTFNYTTTETDGVFFTCHLYLNCTLARGVFYSEPLLHMEQEGIGEEFFRVTSPQSVNAFSIRMHKVGTGEIIYTTVVDVDFTFLLRELGFLTFHPSRPL